jgi:hypothetical protein
VNNERIHYCTIAEGLRLPLFCFWFIRDPAGSK